MQIINPTHSSTRFKSENMSSSIGPWYGGRGHRGGGGGRANEWFSSPYSSDIWEGDDTAALAHANVDWRETDKSHLFHVDLPGLKKEEVKVVVEDNNILQISGERVKEEEEDTGKWHRVERHQGSFVRRFRLPENVNLDEIKCVLEHGVLNVEVPKKDVQESPRNVRYIDVA